MKWQNSINMTCIHGIVRSNIDYVIFYIPLYKRMLNLEILNEFVTLNLEMHSDHIDNNSHGHKNMIFNGNECDLFLNDLKNDLLPLLRFDNIEDLYPNFTIVLSSSINKFSIEVLGEKKNRKTNP